MFPAQPVSVSYS